MASKANIFSALPVHHSDSEDDDATFTKNKTKKTTDKGDRTKQDTKGGAKGTAGRGGAAGVAQKPAKEEHARAKEARKEKGVSDQPHPLDRHSGTGAQAYGGKPKKSGAGKANWGSYKDEKKPAEDVEGAEEGEEAQPAEEEKPSLTLQEYYQRQNIAKHEPEVNEAKAKITSAQLMKEMGTATLLKGRHAQEIDDRNAGKKKDRLNAEHKAVINTEYADLLGFRTGFIEKEYRQRGEGESPTKPGERKGGRREPREQENAKEEETQPTTTTEAGATTEAQEGQAGEKAEGEKAAGGQERRGGRGGQRGGQRGGNRPQGERRPYQGKQEATKINFDESAFPKLG